MGSIKHAKTSPVPNPLGDTRRVGGGDWNSEHIIDLDVSDIDGLEARLIPVDQVEQFRDDALQFRNEAAGSASDAAASAAEAAATVGALAAPGGAELIGTPEGTVQEALDGRVKTLQNYAALLAYPGTVPIQITSMGIVGPFRYNPALPNTTNGCTRFAHASGTGAWERLHDGVFYESWCQPNKDGTVSGTSKLQAFFDAAAAESASEIVFAGGTRRITNPRNDAAYTCAVVLSGLEDCLMRGAPGTKFIAAPGGAGSAEFGLFRIEQSRHIHLTGFEMDSSLITITGSGPNRSNCIICVNFDVNNAAADLPVANADLTFSNLNLNNAGGGITVARRGTTLAITPKTVGFSVYDTQMLNLLGVDHGVSLSSVWGARIRNVHCRNDIGSGVVIQDNMGFDASSDCENVIFENSSAYGFVFGAKAESHINAGPSGNETRPSKNVSFINCRFDEIGDPTVLVWPGTSGGDTFGLKINCQNYLVENVTVTPRTIGVTTGGLGLGIALVNTHGLDSNGVVIGNYTKGAQIGYLHNDSTPTTRRSTVFLGHNRSDDAVLYGLVAQSNITAEDNHFHRAGRSAIVCQLPNNSAFRRSIAIDCAATNNPTIGAKVVFAQEEAGPYGGYFEWTENVIEDNRGASAAEYGYFLASGTTRTNDLKFIPGRTKGLLTAVTFDPYVPLIGDSLQTGGVLLRPQRTIVVTGDPSVTAPWNTMTTHQPGDRAIIQTPSVGSPYEWVFSATLAWVSLGNL